MPLAVGDTVPDFELPVRGKESAKLSTALANGPVVLLTYILDWSPGWTNELSEFGKRIDEFKQLNAQVYGISVDSTWSHDAWRKELKLPAELVLLSDFNRDFGGSYDLLTNSATGMKNILRRAVLVVGQDGKVIYRWDVPDPPRLPTVDEVLDAMRGAGAVR
jgi:glutaredoxin-dependent peroxiredoxin